MILIAHRGNIIGPSIFENDPEYLAEIIEKGFAVEVDVWSEHGRLRLGHDRPDYLVSKGWLDRYAGACIFHCKNVEALEAMRQGGHHYFWHQEDDYTLTSKGFVWVYPNRPYLFDRNFIYCQPDATALPRNWEELGGICSDYVEILRQEKEVSNG